MAKKPSIRSVDAAYDSEWIYELIDKEIKAATASGDRPSAVTIGQRVSEVLMKAFDDDPGDRRVRTTIDVHNQHALRDVVKGRLRASANLTIAYNGRVLQAVPVASVAIRRQDGTRERSGQYALWLDATWEEVESLVESQQNRREGLARNIDQMELALSLRAKHPQAKTPREAFELAGISYELESTAI